MPHGRDEERRDVAAKLVAAQEAERSRIARELHDDLGQQIALMAARLDTLLRERTGSIDRLRRGLMEAQASLQNIASTVHDLSHRLHPPKLRLLGLVRTLETLCRDVSSESGIHVTFEAGRIPPNSTEPLALCLFRVTQEALQNAVKHSGAKTIRVRLNGTSSELALRVSDDGHGFDPLTSQSDGIGLLTMRERVELSGGRLRIETAHDRGTTVEARVPLPHVPLRTWRPTRPAGVSPRQARARVRRLPSAC